MDCIVQGCKVSRDTMTFTHVLSWEWKLVQPLQKTVQRVLRKTFTNVEISLGGSSNCTSGCGSGIGNWFQSSHCIPVGPDSTPSLHSRSHTPVAKSLCRCGTQIHVSQAADPHANKQIKTNRLEWSSVLLICHCMWCRFDPRCGKTLPPSLPKFLLPECSPSRFMNRVDSDLLCRQKDLCFCPLEMDSGGFLNFFFPQEVGRQISPTQELYQIKRTST